MPDALIDCVVTSPAYWGLRDYGTEPQIWGGDPECKHKWGEEIPGDPRGGSGPSAKEFYAGNGKTTYARQVARGNFCHLCGAWRGSLGLEPTLDLYISHLVEIFREVRRVLKDEGTLWLNMGDAYCGGGRAGKNGQAYGGLEAQNRCNAQVKWGPPTGKIPGLKPKDLIGQPWRLAFALQADGWYLRSDVIEEVELYCPCGCGYVLEERIWRWSQDRDLIWHKPNPMPESVTDRPTKSHEYIFLLSKKAKYFYDAEAVSEKLDSDPKTWGRHSKKDPGMQAPVSRPMFGPGRNDRDGTEWGNGHSRNKRTVWTVATQPFPEAHFATFPEKLIEPCIRAGTSEKGYCAECGKPWVRVIESTGGRDWRNDKMKSKGIPGELAGSGSYKRGQSSTPLNDTQHHETLGWQPSCSCGADIVPGLILDPFGGAGTVALVAKKLNRDFLIIELKPEYCDMARRRLAERMPLFVGGERGKG